MEALGEALSGGVERLRFGEADPVRRAGAIPPLPLHVPITSAVAVGHDEAYAKARYI
jgi:hypothetical protein